MVIGTGCRCGVWICLGGGVRRSRLVLHALQHGFAPPCHVEFILHAFRRFDAIFHILARKIDRLGGQDRFGAAGKDHRAMTGQFVRVLPVS